MKSQDRSSTVHIMSGKLKRPGDTSRADAGRLAEAVSNGDVDVLDGCDIALADETLDEELPPTEGGVA